MKIKFLIIYSVLFFTNCSNKINDINLAYPERGISDFALNIEMNYYLKGNLDFKLIAEEMNQVIEDSQEIN